MAARQLAGSTKSTTSGKIQSLTSGKFGQPTRLDQVYNFFENKLSPAASVVKDILKGQTFEGDKPSLLNEAENVFVPFPIKNIYTDPGPGAANHLLILIADALGISTNTYKPRK